MGDLNIAPLEHDVWSHKQLLDVVSHTPVETTALLAWQRTCFVDALRHFVPAGERLFTWWSYRNRDWRLSNRGRRLDHIWGTPDLVGTLRGHTVLRDGDAIVTEQRAQRSSPAGRARRWAGLLRCACNDEPVGQ